MTDTELIFIDFDNPDLESLQVASQSTRLKILNTLTRTKKMYASNLATELGYERKILSFHLNALEKVGLQANQVDEVILGNVLQAGLGQNPARQAAIQAGFPETVSAMTINKVCGSGLKAVHLAVHAADLEQVGRIDGRKQHPDPGMPRRDGLAIDIPDLQDIGRLAMAVKLNGTHVRQNMESVRGYLRTCAVRVEAAGKLRSERKLVYRILIRPQRRQVW